MNRQPLKICRPLSDNMKKYYSSNISLRENAAVKLAKKGDVEILGNSKVMVDNCNYKNRRVSQKVAKTYITSDYKGQFNSFPVVTPFGEGGNLAKAYNTTVDQFAKDWILMIDHDILLATNPYWYEICNAAINQVGHDAGWITCVTNRIKCRYQKASNISADNDDMRYHRNFAKELYQKKKGRLLDATALENARFSGLFILTHREAWKKVNGFNEGIGFYGVDCDYSARLKNAGYKLFVMLDLYVYHGYFRETLLPFFKTKEDFNEEAKRP